MNKSNFGMFISSLEDNRLTTSNLYAKISLNLDFTTLTFTVKSKINIIFGIHSPQIIPTNLFSKLQMIKKKYQSNKTEDICRYVCLLKY